MRDNIEPGSRRGKLSRGGLPDEIRTKLTAMNVTIAEPYYVLSTAPDGMENLYLIIAAVFGGIAVLIPLLLFKLRLLFGASAA